MTIGQQLKKTRLLFGLTQEEMSAGIVSKSFYSRVERDKNAITINKLIAMLNANNISLNDFFRTFDNEGLPELKVQRKIYTAYNERNIVELHQIEKSLSSKNDVLFYKTKLIIATL
ncbi:helix-turn-helix domain-containing protein, partial [Lactobacillus helveticus]